MDPAQTAKNYDGIAEWWRERHTDSGYGVKQLERAISFTKERRTALDVGCGSSGRFIEVLLQAGFATDGMDVSEVMVEQARQVHPDASFHIAEISTWQPGKSYDLISAWDSTFHLPLDRQQPALRNMANALQPGGVLIFTFGGGDKPGTVSGNFQNHDFEYSTLAEARFLELIGKFGLTCRHLEYDQGAQEPHVYMIAQKAP